MVLNSVLQQHIDLEGAGFVVNPAFHKVKRKRDPGKRSTVWPPGGAGDGDAAPAWHGRTGGNDDTVGASILQPGDAMYMEPQDSAGGPSADHVYELAVNVDGTSKQAQKEKRKNGGKGRVKGGGEPEQRVIVGPPRRKTGRIVSVPDSPTTSANSSFKLAQPSVKDKKKNNAATAGSVPSIYGKFEWYVT